MESLGPEDATRAATRRPARLVAAAGAAVAALAISAALLVANGDDGTDTQTGTAAGADQTTSTSTGPGDATSTTTPGGAGTSTTAARGGSSSGATTTTTIAPPPTLPPPNDGYQFKMTLSATCVHPGDSMTITLELEPQSPASVMALYSDYQHHGAQHHGVAGADGRFTYTFKVAPTTGRATVYASASRRSDNKNGSASAGFEVLEATRPC